MLGVEGKAEGSVGTAKAEAKGKFSVGEDGVNANVKVRQWSPQSKVKHLVLSIFLV